MLWRHCHTHDCEVHESTVASVMIGDTFHNFVDGAVIGAAVLTSVPLGVSTAIAVAAHEIPQELGDFAILLHAGYSRREGVAVERAVRARQRRRHDRARSSRSTSCRAHCRISS